MVGPWSFSMPGGVALRRLLSNLLTITSVALALTVMPVGARAASAIAHGQDAPEGDYRFSVRLTMTGIPTTGRGTRDSWCSGALIAPRWVVTAGHCFREADDRRVSRPVARRTTATVGRTDLDQPGGHQVDVVAVRQAETADVALAELGTPVTDVTPLRVGTTPPRAGEKVRLTGYGLAGSGSTTPARLQTGQFVVDRVGDSLLEISGRVPRRDTSACEHDSGGPYFHEEQDGTPALVAVVSTGPTCPHEGPDLSARTDQLAEWIAGTIKTEPRSSGHSAVLVGGLALALAGAAVVLGLAYRRQRAVSP
jgi:secreted trypsin-like serine protease